jgi:hypothetical protein
MDQDFFESSAFWRHEMNKMQGAFDAKKNLDEKEKRKKVISGNSIASNYTALKQQRILPDLHGLKPRLSEEGYPPNLNLFLYSNPTVEKFMNEYVERTERDIEQSITLEQFSEIKWQWGLPSLVI